MMLAYGIAAQRPSLFHLQLWKGHYATLRLVEEVLDPGFGTPLIVEGMGMTIAVELARHLQPRRQVPEIRKGGLSTRQFRRVADLIGDGGPECPTVADLAQACGVSERHLMRTFKQTTGLTIGRYFGKVRTERAIDLLHQALSVKEIAARLGFNSPSHFAAGFRKSTGMTPTAYRRLIRP
jgi:AraC family transcriptional regulator